MKRANEFFIFILLFSIISCRPISMLIAKKNGEFIKPQNESTESIMTYCQTKRVNYDKLFVAKSEDQFSSFLSKYKNIPAVFIFDKNKFLITTAVKTDCPWAMINLLDHSVLESKIIRDTLLYSNLLSYFTLVDAKMKNKDSDYYIICTWAKYFPKLTDALFETINKQKEEKKLNVCHILLNVDLQDSWESKK